jgi:hypothetical protein
MEANMKRLITVCLHLAALVMLATLFTACTQPEVRSQVDSKVNKNLRVGDTVRLFHSGTEDVKKIICLNEEITVYNEKIAAGVRKSTEVGKIKVIKYVDENYYDAKVVEGVISAGDIARKDTAACLIEEMPVDE